MTHLFLDSRRRMRNGWWMLVFVALVALTAVAYRPFKHLLQGAGVTGLWLEPVPVLLALLATWGCTRLRREPLSSVGLRLDRGWLAQVTAGTLLGMTSMAVVVAMIWTTGGVRFAVAASAGPQVLVRGLYVFLWAALLEELLFRGFLFQRFVAGAGPLVAQLVMAALFAVAHWGNPGMEGATVVWATLDTALGAVMLGLAWLRTRSLALPLGLHLGWNFMQGTVLGFGVSGHEGGGLLQPLFQGLPEWLTGGTFGPESSVFAVVADLTAIVILWRWRGTGEGVARTEAAAGTAVMPASANIVAAA